MTGPARMGIALPTGASLGKRQRHCPGACLRISREDYLAMKREGYVFTTSSQDIRQDGLSDARTLCHDDVAEIRVAAGKEHGVENGRTVFAMYDAGLCAGCAALERNNRADLTGRLAARPR